MHWLTSSPSRSCFLARWPVLQAWRTWKRRPTTWIRTWWKRSCKLRSRLVKPLYASCITRCCAKTAYVVHATRWHCNFWPSSCWFYKMRPSSVITRRALWIRFTRRNSCADVRLCSGIMKTDFAYATTCPQRGRTNLSAILSKNRWKVQKCSLVFVWNVEKYLHLFMESFLITYLIDFPNLTMLLKSIWRSSTSAIFDCFGMRVSIWAVFLPNYETVVNITTLLSHGQNSSRYFLQNTWLQLNDWWLVKCQHTRNVSLNPNYVPWWLGQYHKRIQPQIPYL